MFFIVQEHVKPSMTKQYEAAGKRLIAAMKAANIRNVTFDTVAGPEIGYVYVMPIDGFAAMDGLRESWMDAIGTIGEETYAEINASADEAVQSTDRHHVVRRDDLSYSPEDASMDKGAVRYISYNFYYVIPGRTREFEALGKEFVSLYQEHGIDVGWTMYQSITGTDLPLYVMAMAGKSPGDVFGKRDEIYAKLGAAGHELMARSYSMIRRVEQKSGTPRPDLSYTPGQ
jgi:hypothetical protein